MARELPKQKKGLERWESVGRGALYLPLVVSYFTDLLYLREAFELARSCQVNGLDFVIEQVEDLRSWEGNTNYKPTFLKRLHARFPARALLWLDADARVRRVPSLFQSSATVKVAYHTWQGKRALSGTVFLGAGPERLSILEAWEKEVAISPRATDQVCLQRAIMHLGLTHMELPETYCWIYDLSTRHKAQVASPLLASPVIEHMQASRIAKGKI